MNSIYILGSGGFAKEVFVWINDIGGYEVKGFVDIVSKDPVPVGDRQVPVFPEDYILQLPEKPLLAIGVGDPKLIGKLSARFSPAFEFPNLIHPSVIGNFSDIKMGVGNVITPNCVFTTTITLGSFNAFNLNCTIGHDAVIGSCNVFNPMVNVSGGVVIGDNNLIGVKATILQYKTIGSNSVVGAGSLVLKNVPDNVTVFGTPARKL